VGQLLNDGNNDLLIAGVVDDVHAEGTEGDAGWQIYYPISQNFPNYAQLVVRTTLPPATMSTSVLTALRELNPKQPVAEFRPIQSMVDHANSPRRFFMMLVASFATLGLILAALGIYGVVSYSVTQRTQEIGIRLALGSQRTSIMRLVLASGVKLGLIGCGLGAIGAVFATRLLRSVLFQVDPLDPTVSVLAVVSIFLLALAACWIPAHRAASIDPMQALRTE
jgi:ABC-type antimicrobial peptide transport system permease subunit